MRKLKVKTVVESPSLKKVFSNQNDKMEYLKEIILKMIEEGTKIDKRKELKELRQYLESYKRQKYPTNLKELTLVNYETTTETAYQREIFKLDKAILNTKGLVLWIDIELPVEFNKNPKRKSVDLIGLLNDNTPVLCELKLASKETNYYSDSPIYAVIELLIYYYLILDNWRELDDQNVFHKEKRVKDFKWDNFNQSSVFLIAANDIYWNYWKNRYERERFSIESWLKLILPFTIQFFSTGSFDLTNQKELPNNLKSNIKEWQEFYL